jgi:hypothetical protein
MKNIVIYILNYNIETAELLPTYCRVINLSVLIDDCKLDRDCDIIKVVRMRRLELPHREAPDPKSGVSTNFTTSAINFFEKMSSW